MSYKTILAHCNDKARVARVANVAAEIASRFSAHLIGLSVSPPVHLIPAGMPGTPDVIVDDARRVAYRKDIPDLKHTFLEASQARGVPAEWRERDAEGASLSRIVLAAARRADLVVLAQKDQAWPNSAYLDVDDVVIMGAGRPVLLVPNDGSTSAAARRVLVAWSDIREASRTVFDALPLLQKAEDVRVVSIGAGEADARLEEADLDICTALLRHNVKCKATQRIEAHADVGRSLTEQAIAQKADLLVMGCYGHSRLREFVLGGASRYQLRHMIIPVFMSH
jgi:nucleotide-binding universal stress UspA family protein